ncbi:MAG: hypothetical protein HYX94_03240 [Chloroflexi bacterium]|nr:hypothetical protein [Chloroflexota bacterium]
MKTERLTIIFAADLARELRELVPKGERSKLIVEATRDRLVRFRQERALELTAGAWSDQNHPEFTRPEDVVNWIRELRSSADRRLDRIHSRSSNDE